jgi:hypothetical protein
MAYQPKGETNMAPKIKIKDIPKGTKVSAAELKNIRGGLTLSKYTTTTVSKTYPTTIGRPTPISSPFAAEIDCW